MLAVFQGNAAMRCPTRLALAAAGRHNIIMIGPPVPGKTMLAKRVPTVLTQLSAPESIETTRIYGGDCHLVIY